MVEWVRRNKTVTILIVLIFLLALWLRADFLTSVKHKVSHDTNHYMEMVERLLDKGIYAYKEEVPNARVTPGYPLFMTALYLVADQRNVELYPLIRWVQALISVASLIPMFIIAMLVTRNKWVATFAIFLGAVYHPFIWATGAVLTETLALFFLMCYLAMQIYAFKTQRKRDAAIAGLLLGITVLVRAEFLPIFVPLYGVFLLQQWFPRKMKRKAAAPVKRGAVFKRVALLGIITGLCLSATMLPWWIRNVVTLNEFVLTASQTNPFKAGTYPDKDYSDKIVDPTGLTQNEVALARIKAGFTQQTWKYVKWYTIGKLEYTYNRMFFGSGHEPGFTVYPRGHNIHQLIVYGSLIPILLLLWRWRHPAVMLVVVIIIMSMIRLLFVPEYRYNFTVMPLFIILFSWLAVYMLEKLRGMIRPRKTA
ncbi:hypothetical protein [Paenibacillus sp. sgz302251]|uniref:hypothetical protein n=1 Tax=Paenibacillus sp. sgz302251 TaxID=3414493 RepID=UPI003C7E5A50